MRKDWSSSVFHESSDFSGRQRDVFPLPFLMDEGPLKSNVCRAVAKRYHLKRQVVKRTNLAIGALNSFFSGSGCSAGRVVVDTLNGLPLVQQDVLRRLIKQVKDFGCPPPGKTSQEALLALRAAASGYLEPEAGVGDVVAMELESLSLPSCLVGGVNLVDALDHPLKDKVQDFEDWMLRDASSWSEVCQQVHLVKPYNDPALRNRKKYLGFLQRLAAGGILSWTRTCRGRVGAFAVSKKAKVIDGVVHKRQRLVLDCRQTNLQFKDAPYTNLGSLSAVCELEVPPEQDLYISGGDIRDCFYAVVMPSALSDFFCLSIDLSPQEASSIFGQSDGLAHDGGGISPCLSVLPMGFSWSFYLVQQLHQQSAMRALDIHADRILLDGHPAPMLEEGWIAMPYCDNVHVLALASQDCQLGKERAVKDLEDLGFEIHEQVESTTLFPTLGGIIDGSSGEVRPTYERGWNILLGFSFLLDHPVSSQLVQRLLGHAMTICTICRYGMPVFRHLYDYVEKEHESAWLNKHERREVEVFIGILPLLVGQLKKEWYPCVTCTDASPEGFGICEQAMDECDIRNMGRWQERWRFKLLPPSAWRPRERALRQDPFSDLGTAAGVSHLVHQDWEYVADDSFPEIDRSVLEPSKWKTVKLGKWNNKQEPITVKEGRALVLALRRLARSSKARNKRHLIFVDSLTLAFCVCKGRSSSYKLLRICQQISALCLATGIKLRVRWIPSEWNIADGPSRGQIKAGPYKPREQCETDSCKQEQQNLERQRSDSAVFEEDTSESPSGAEGFQREGQTEEGNEGSHSSFESCESEELFPALSAAPPQGTGDWRRNSSTSREDDDIRDQECIQRSGGPIFQIPGELQEFLQGSKPPLATKSKGCRRAHGRLHGCDVLERKAGQRGGEGPGKRGVRLRPVEGINASKQACSSRMEERDATPEQDPGSQVGHLWTGHDHDLKGQAIDGVEDPSGLRLLPETRGEHRPACQERDCSSGSSRAPIPVAFTCDSGLREPASRQGGHLRQQSPVEQSGPRMVGSALVETCQDEERPGRLALQLHSRGVSKTVRVGGQEVEPGGVAPLPDEAWRGSRGFEFPNQGLCLSQGKRKVEYRPKPEEVHESGKSPTAAEPIVVRASGVLSMVTPQHGTSDEGKYEIPRSLSALLHEDVFSAKAKPSRFALEIFAGTARVAGMLCQHGIPTYPIDICLFPSHDVLDVNVEHRILNWIRAGVILFVWLGMPCTSFSRARKFDGLGPPPLRTDEFLWGLPHLNAKDRLKVHTGNALFAFTLRVMRLCEQYNIPYALENPASSMAWLLKPIKLFIRDFQPDVVNLDFCCFGEVWRKPTQLLTHFFPSAALGRTCTPYKGRCSQTHKPHQRLVGQDSNGVFWTLRAQPYPWELAKSVAEQVAKSLPTTASCKG